MNITVNVPKLWQYSHEAVHKQCRNTGENAADKIVQASLSSLNVNNIKYALDELGLGVQNITIFKCEIEQITSTLELSAKNYKLDKLAFSETTMCLLRCLICQKFAELGDLTSALKLYKQMNVTALPIGARLRMKTILVKQAEAILKSQGHTLAIVLTGGTGSGKTTTLRKLKLLDYPTISEAAERILIELNEIGSGFDGILKRGLDAFQREITDRYLEDEKKNMGEKLHFQDRALYDSVAFSTHYCQTQDRLPVSERNLEEYNVHQNWENTLENQIEKASTSQANQTITSDKNRYTIVFMPDPLPTYEEACIRKGIDKQDSKELHEILHDVYERKRFPVIKVPSVDQKNTLLTPVQRVEFMLDQIIQFANKQQIAANPQSNKRSNLTNNERPSNKKIRII